MISAGLLLICLFCLSGSTFAQTQKCTLDGLCDPDAVIFDAPQQHANAAVTKPRPGVYFIVSDFAEGQVLDWDRQAHAIILHRKNGGENQKWRIDDRGIIENVHTGHVLDVWSHEPPPPKGHPSKPRNGPKTKKSEMVYDLLLHERHNGPNQQWRFGGDGTIRSKSSGKALDVWERDGTHSTIVFDPHGKSNQRWRLEPTTAKKQPRRSSLDAKAKNQRTRHGKSGKSGDSADL